MPVSREEAFAGGIFQPYRFANAAVNAIEADVTSVFPPERVGGEGCKADIKAIPAEAVEHLTEVVVAIVAELVQVYIDAGSEREVTMENEALYAGIKSEFASWVVSDEERADAEQRGQWEGVGESEEYPGFPATYRWVPQGEGDAVNDGLPRLPAAFGRVVARVHRVFRPQGLGSRRLLFGGMLASRAAVSVRCMAWHNTTHTARL